MEGASAHLRRVRRLDPIGSSFARRLRSPHSPPSLQEAERASADALVRHDQAAFVAMFAPDAESSLPVEKHGSEAIANSWLPFLIDPGSTMLLESTEVTTGSTTAPAMWSAKIGHHQLGYMVMLFADAPYGR